HAKVDHSWNVKVGATCEVQAIVLAPRLGGADNRAFPGRSRRFHVDHVCFALPVLAGQTDRTRAFMRQLDTNRREEFDRSERRIGISKELWFLAALPSGD